MTPQEEQAAMQAYVRQRLARQGQQQQLNLTPGQQPLAPEDQAQFLQRPPIAPGVGPPLSGAENSEIARDAGPSPTYQGSMIGMPPGGGPPEPLGGTPMPTVGMQNEVYPQRLQDTGRALRQSLPNSRFMVRKTIPF